VLAVVQAGGQGGRMDVLTRERAKPALPWGGTHRLIDFPLSSLVYGGFNDVWVSVEYQVASIDQYLSGGRPWDLDSNRGGFRRIVPQTGSGAPTEDAFAFGNGDLLLRMSRDIESHGADHLVVCSADHVFAEDLGQVYADHVDSGAEATVLTAEVSREEAAQNTALAVDSSGRVTGVQDHVDEPDSGTVATEIFLYRVAPLLETLRDLRAELSGEADEAGDSGIGDVGEHLLPRLVEQGTVRAVPMAGYWRDVGRPETYLQSHRDLLAGKVDVFGHEDRPIISKWEDRTSARVVKGAEISDSLLAPGCEVAGTVVRSVLGPGVVVEKGAHVEDAVLWDDVVVERGARVQTAVVDQRVRFARGARVGAQPRARLARDEDLVLVGRDCVVGGEVAPGGRLEPGSRT
jgi:glucose-1-phosphate adenylyltransferase